MKKIIRSRESVVQCRLAVVRDAQKRAKDTKDTNEARYWRALAGAFFEDATRHELAKIAGPSVFVA